MARRRRRRRKQHAETQPEPAAQASADPRRPDAQTSRRPDAQTSERPAPDNATLTPERLFEEIMRRLAERRKTQKDAASQTRRGPARSDILSFEVRR